MLLNEIKPAPHLAAYIRLYRIIDFNFPNGLKIPPKLYSPRPEQCLQFYPKDTEAVSYRSHPSKKISGKKVTFVGQHTLLQERQIGNRFLSLQVIFQPGAFYQLTGIGMHELLNQYLDATDLLGTSVHDVNEQLFHASSYREMILIIEIFLSSLIKKIKRTEHAVDISGKMMLRQEATFSVDKFLSDACLSHRQFDRKFKENIGTSPKEFLRIIRFDKAYRMKNRNPELDWLSIAISCGYHDYQHLAKDYKEFTGYTPVQFFALDNGAPERTFGEAEV